jgi:hypothetical protein
MIPKLLLPLTCILILSGCVSTNYVPQLPYVAPAGSTPPAILNSKLPRDLGRHQSMTFTVLEDISCERRTHISKSLFSVSEVSKSFDVAKPVRMSADQLITLHYEATMPGNLSCSMMARVRFESGKTYSLYHGNKIPSGFAHLFDNGTCSFSIVDESTNVPLPMTQIKNTCEE